MQHSKAAAAVAWDNDIDDATYRLLVDAIPDYAIFVLDADGHVRSWNRGAQRIKGYAPEEIIGRHFSVFYPKERIEAGWPEHELAVARASGRFEDEGWRLRKDGSRFWANVVISRIDAPDGSLRGFAKITRDLSARREHEELLRRSEERFRLLVEGVRDYAIFMLDPQGRVASWNRGAEQIKGYRADEVLGRHFSLFYPPEIAAGGWPDRELEIALAKGRVQDEGWRVRKDGSRFWASVAITPLFDQAGHHLGFAKVTRDLTDQRRVLALEDEGRRLTTFLAMLGHELRNPLAPIANAVSVMQLENIPSDNVRRCRDVIARQVGQLTHLIDQLLDVGRITSGKIHLDLQPLDLRSVINAALETVEPDALRCGHTLIADLPSAEVRVRGDQARLLQVFSNLLNNAVKFTPPGGRITVSLHAPHGVAEVAVRDNGPGIAPHRLADIFNLFVQGDADPAQGQSGLGLGLSLVQQLVSLHRGEVSAFSSGVPGKGAEFVVRLPAEPDAEREAASAADTPAQLRHLLVVDADPAAAAELEALLQQFGYRAYRADDVTSALELIRTVRLDAVFVAAGLPDFGPDVVGRLCDELPEPPPFIVLAAPGEAQAPGLRGAGFRAQLSRPVVAAELAGVLKQLFD